MRNPLKRKNSDNKSSKRARDTSPIRTKKRRVSKTFDLDQLQVFIRRNPQVYRDDFLRQLEAFRANTELFRHTPNVYLKQFDVLTSFVMRLAHLYPNEAKALPDELFILLKQFAKVMDPKMRNTFVQGLMHLRGKNVVSQSELYPPFIRLAAAADKALRKLVESFIINDIVKTARKHKDLKVASKLQTVFGDGIQDDNPHISKLSLIVLTKLYSKNVWNDAKTVNQIANGCFAKNSTTSASSVKFFLGKDETEEGADDSDDSDGGSKGTKKKNVRNEKQLLLAHRVGKKTQKRQKRLERARRMLKKVKSKEKRDPLNFSAINLLYDPQAFAEKLYKMLIKSNQKYEVRLSIMSLISRLIGTQELILMNYYPFLQKYLQPRQRDVTKVLLFVAQAAHAFVPPETLGIVLRTIADNFVTDAHASEVIAVGLNAIREVFIRCPLALTEDLAGDLIDYRKHRDKAVQMAARALVQSIRDHNPIILRRKDRGRPTEDVLEEEQNVTPVYGAPIATKDYIPGAEILLAKNDDSESVDTEKGEVESENEVDAADAESEDEDISVDEGGSDGDGDSDSNYHGEGYENGDEEGEKREKRDETVVKKVLAMPFDQRIKLAREISHNKILDDEDFARIKKLQFEKSLTAAKKKKTVDPMPVNESDESTDIEDVTAVGELPSLGDIQRGCGIKRDHDKAARIATVLKGREGREKYSGRSKPKMNPFASTSNRDKLRNKAFMMVRRKIVQQQNQRSFKAKQERLHKALVKLAKKGK